MKASTWYAGLLVAVVFLFSLWSLLRTGRAISDWQILVEYGAPAVYLLVSGLAWSLAGLGLLAALFYDWQHTRRAGIAISVLYWLWYWTDRLFIQQSPAPNLVFSAFFSTALLLAILPLWSLSNAKDFSTEEIE